MWFRLEQKRRALEAAKSSKLAEREERARQLAGVKVAVEEAQKLAQLSADAKLAAARPAPKPFSTRILG